MVEPWVCPRCERTTTDRPALSRYAWGDVCSRCGAEEGLQQASDAGVLSPEAAAAMMDVWEKVHDGRITP